MEILITYDVATDSTEGERRLRQVAQICKNYGQRVQKSVFECTLDEMQYEKVVFSLLKVINEKEDSLRIYRLREPKDQHIREFGVTKSINYKRDLILI